jgi:hypothetical protein
MTAPDSPGRALGSILALAQGGAEAAEGVLAPSVGTWLASPAQGITASIDFVSGIEPTVAVLSDLAPCTLIVTGAVVTPTATWAEVGRRAAGVEETCVVGLSHDARGLVTRLVWFRAPAVPTSGLATEADSPYGRPSIESYFSDLVASDFPAAAAHFTADTIYSHPPYGGRLERALFRGRDALLDGLVHQRGSNPVRQVITGFWQERARIFVEGVVEGIPNGGTFVATAEMSTEGEIARFVAFYAGRRMPRTIS